MISINNFFYSFHKKFFQIAGSTLSVIVICWIIADSLNIISQVSNSNVSYCRYLGCSNGHNKPKLFTLPHNNSEQHSEWIRLCGECTVGFEKWNLIFQLVSFRKSILIDDKQYFLDKTIPFTSLNFLFFHEFKNISIIHVIMYIDEIICLILDF